MIGAQEGEHAVSLVRVGDAGSVEGSECEHLRHRHAPKVNRSDADWTNSPSNTRINLR